VPRRTAVFLGNSIFGDDQIGLVVGRMLEGKLTDLGFDVQIVERTGFALLDCLEGYDSAVVVDSVSTGKDPAGQVLFFEPEDFARVQTGVPHFAGVPEAVQLMKELNLGATSLAIIGINVKDPYTLSESLSDDLKRGADDISRDVYTHIAARKWAGASA
jgi:hydrogenase maturation protease